MITTEEKPSLIEQTCPDNIILCAHKMLDACRSVVDQVWRQNLTVHIKGDGKPVTQLDYALETLMLSHIKEYRPNDGIIGEEFGVSKDRAEYTWVLDPIDDTAGLITGAPDFSVVVACLHQGNFLCGMIDQPIMRDRWVGAQGYAVSCNDKRTVIRKDVSLSEAYIAVSTPRHSHRMDKVVQKAQLVVKQNALSFGLLASGRLDAVILEQGTLFDFAAMVPIVQGAGGKVTDIQGHPIGLDYKGPILVTVCSELHKEILQNLS